MERETGIRSRKRVSLKRARQCLPPRTTAEVPRLFHGVTLNRRHLFLLAFRRWNSYRNLNNFSLDCDVVTGLHSVSLNLSSFVRGPAPKESDFARSVNNQAQFSVVS